MPEWLTIEEAAGYFKVSKPTIYRWCSDGRLPFLPNLESIDLLGIGGAQKLLAKGTLDPLSRVREKILSDPVSALPTSVEIAPDPDRFQPIRATHRRASHRHRSWPACSEL